MDVRQPDAGRRSEQKLSDGATIWLDAYNELAVSLGPDDRTDLVMVYAGERDGLGFGFCEAPHPGLDCAGLKWNLAASTGKTLAEIEALPPCEYYGFEGGSADDHCDHIESYDEGHDWVHFSAIVRYDID